MSIHLVMDDNTKQVLLGGMVLVGALVVWLSLIWGITHDNDDD